ncbi:cysteine hydrolase family protein [Marinomonas sp. RSW2]|uniref:Cysteine hydrolase family protein n=1 Tax=Marinomonas maritima TaxID=2940935 RepID=A0ABT5WA31_9GAMM|nr:cysteine hydrolase family protein [Marinomonas maritima]MDE8601668.1 cysteine hydrolase family protein [Marinomonas maritima]
MKSAILIIDVQSILFDPVPRPFEADLVVERINRFTSWARANDVVVIHVQHEKAGSEIEFGSAGWQLQAGLKVEEGDEFIRKTTPDSFLRTDLDALLKENDVEHLIVCGYASEFCVDTTVRRAAGLGYSVELVSDAHTTHDKPHASAEQIRAHHNATLPNISSFGVKIAAIMADELMSL